MHTLDKHNYVLFGTRKRSGEMVDTPVWFAREGNQVYLFSAGDAGKVKRLRNFSEARVAPCTVLGKPLGEFIAATAVLLEDEAQIAEAHRALVKAYGMQMRTLDFFAGIFGRRKTRKYILAELQE